jgi:hypothetical protein
LYARAWPYPPAVWIRPFALDSLLDEVTRVVKSAAYLQSWFQHRESSISFDVRETLAWDADTNAFAPECDRRRQADLYVFALLAHRSKATVNPLDVSQWEFLLLETTILDEHIKRQESIVLGRLNSLNPLRCVYRDLARSIGDVEARRTCGSPAAEAATPAGLMNPNVCCPEK